MDVRFCVRCCISNQRPASCNEFANVPGAVKTTIRFDGEGVCDACRVAERMAGVDWVGREAALVELLDRHRSRDGSFDCVVPGSGGKDSFYAAHVLKTRYGMHPLLCTWAATIYTPWGLRNLERWHNVSTHLLYSPNREVHRLLTRLSVERLFHPFATFIYGQKALAPKVAALHRIPLVVYGESEAEYGNPAAEFDRAERDWSYFTRPEGEVCLGGESVRDLRKFFGLTSADLDPYMPADPALLRERGVEVHYLGHYLRWRPQSAYYYAVEHGGFEPSPERTPGTYSKYSSIDDAIDDFHYMTTYWKFGIGRATYDASQEIRSGDITREEGIALVRRYDGEFPGRFLDSVNEYLSVDGFPPMTRERWLELAEKFRPDHLWDGDRLRHRVFDEVTA